MSVSGPVIKKERDSAAKRNGTGEVKSGGGIYCAVEDNCMWMWHEKPMASAPKIASVLHGAYINSKEFSPGVSPLDNQRID